MRGELRLTAALTGVTSAVVGVVLNLAVFFGQEVFLTRGRFDWLAAALSAGAFVLLTRFKTGIIAIVSGCGAVGLLVHALGLAGH